LEHEILHQQQLDLRFISTELFIKKIPPSILSAEPVMYPASAQAKKRIAAAISSGRPKRRIGICSNARRRSTSPMTASASVST